METAMVLPSLLLLLAVALGMIAAAGTQLACADAARVGARALARGEDPEHARDLAHSVAPDHAEVELTDDGVTARVTVRVTLEVGSVLSLPVTLTETAAVPMEPGPGEPLSHPSGAES